MHYVRPMERTYLCIDLKSFYASVECVVRNLDALTTDLVVADASRTDKTICLAVSPSLKAKGVRNRCRLFEIPKSIPFIIAKPRMRLYMEYSANIYGIYLSYVAKEDIHVYSIDEAFLDVTHYLSLYKKSPKELAKEIMGTILKKTGITATCGIGTNLFLAKIALDVTAKHAPDGIAFLDQASFIQQLWDHRPLTDFWKFGKGTEARLKSMGISTLRHLAHHDQSKLAKMFGVDAQLLYDHAWGRENCAIADIHAYQSKSHSLSTAQVLSRDYGRKEALLLVKEMADTLSLSLVEKHLVTEKIALSLSSRWETISSTRNIPIRTNSASILVRETETLYETMEGNSIRHIGLAFLDVLPESHTQPDLFSDPAREGKERKLQLASLSIKQKFGSNAILKAMDLQKGATTKVRNLQIGGHSSGEK